VFFEKHVTNGDYQGNPVINYSEESIPFTRVHEHKHFTPWESHDKTVYFKEYSKETTKDDIPYYPKRLSADMKILEMYQDEVGKLDGYTFLGRTGHLPLHGYASCNCRSACGQQKIY
jgi:UDP-galactopyranose mutase